jgi:hypothetical protein
MNPCLGSLSCTMRMKALACARGCSDHHFDIDACSCGMLRWDGRSEAGEKSTPDRGLRHSMDRRSPSPVPPHLMQVDDVHHEGTGRRGGRGATPTLQEHLQAVSGGDVVVRVFLVLVEDRGSRYSQCARRSASPTMIVPRATGGGG